MIEEIRHGRRSGIANQNRKEWVRTVEELFSELFVDAQALDPEMKLRFVEAFFYTGQRDIRQAMADFDTLGEADRLAIGYLLRSLAQKSRVSPGQAVSGAIGREKRARFRLGKPLRSSITLKG